MPYNQMDTLEDSGWGSAFSIAWKNLTGVNDDSSLKGVRLLFFALFLGGAVWAGYCWNQSRTILEKSDIKPSVSVATVEQDKKRLELLISQIRAAVNLRKQSYVWVSSMRSLEKYVFEDPLKKEIPANVEVKDLPVSRMEVAIDLPPEVVLRAIMKIGKQQMDVMDIVGVGVGIIVKPGDTFMNRTGRVLRIDADKVVVQWAGKNWDILPGLQ